MRSARLKARHVCQPPHCRAVIKCVFGERPAAGKAISQAISGAGIGICCASTAMLSRAMSVLASENDTAGFELSIRCGGFKTTDCYSVDRCHELDKIEHNSALCAAAHETPGVSDATQRHESVRKNSFSN